MLQHNPGGMAVCDADDGAGAEARKLKNTEEQATDSILPLNMFPCFGDSSYASAISTE